MDIKIEEQDDFFCVCVKVDRYNSREKKKTIVNTGRVKIEMQKRGYQIGEVVQNDYINNLNGKTHGTWFFEKKVEKSLDKPVQDVIIEVEKEVKPKPARKRRTRSSTKKVSTEE